jgi:RHS repeat-associated protein
LPVRSQITCLNYRSGDPHTHPPGPVYLIGRYYDPQTGQFLSVDPAVEQTLEAYLYAGDYPVNSSDPNGLWC